MADRKRTGTNNQKRSVSVLSTPFVEADILVAGSVYATLPSRSLIVRITVLITTVSGTASSTLDLDANGTEVGSEIAATVLGGIVEVPVSTAAYLSTGGDIVLQAGAVTPADGALVGELIVEYIELDKTTGEYTDE